MSETVRTRTTTHGCVVVFGGVEVYYGRCKECAGFVGAQRHGSEVSRGGRWPSLCPSCRERRDKAHDDSARRRMAAKRTKEYASRDKQFADRGWEPVRQGVRHSTTDPKECEWCMSSFCHCD